MRFVAIGCIEDLEIAVVYTVRSEPVASSRPGGPEQMSEKTITRRSAADLKRGKTDYRRLRRHDRREIANAAKRDKDAARLDIDWSSAEVVVPDAKQAISIRLDRDIVEFFKRTGRAIRPRSTRCCAPMCSTRGAERADARW